MNGKRKCDIYMNIILYIMFYIYNGGVYVYMNIILPKNIRTSCHFNNMDGTGGYYTW